MNKLESLKKLLNIAGTDQDEVLSVYLSFTQDEILSWLYSGNTPENVEEILTRYEPTQMAACMAGFGISGAEGQTSHSENGISRTFKYEDMVAYIRNHVTAFIGVV